MSDAREVTLDSAARLRRAARARSRKYVAWQPGELCFYWREGRSTVELPGRRGAWCGPATILMQERRRVGNVESMTGVVWLFHGKAQLRATPEQLRPATAAERVGEAQNTNLDMSTQMIDILPNVVAVDLTGQIGPIEENIDGDMIMVGPPDERDPAGEPETAPEPESEALVSESDQELPVSEPDQGLLVFEVAPELRGANPIKNGLNPILMRRLHRRLKRIPLLLEESRLDSIFGRQ